MTATSIIFWLIFALPLVAFMVWLMRQDKRQGKWGLLVLLLIVVGVIVYMYFRNQFTPGISLPE